MYDLTPMVKNGKYGFVDSKGKFKIQPIFDEVCVFTKSLTKVKIQSKWGLIDFDGTYLVRPQYDEITDLDNNGVSMAMADDLWGTLNATGDVVVQPTFSKKPEQLTPDVYKVCKEGLYGVMNSSGKLLINIEYDSIMDSDPLVIVMKDLKYGFAKTTGEIIIKPQLKNTPIFNHGLARVVVDDECKILFQNGTLQTIQEYDEALYKKSQKDIREYILDSVIPQFTKSHLRSLISSYDNWLKDQGAVRYIKDDILTESQKTHMQEVMFTVFERYSPSELEKWAEENKIDRRLIAKETGLVQSSRFGRGDDLEERIEGAVYTHQIYSQVPNIAAFLFNAHSKKDVLRIGSTEHKVIDLVDKMIKTAGGKGRVVLGDNQKIKYIMNNGQESSCKFVPEETVRLSNGDLLLKCRINFDTKIRTNYYTLPGQRVTIMGNNMVIGGGTFRDDDYSSTDHHFAVIFDGVSGGAKYYMGLPIDNGWKIVASKYNGFWCINDAEYRQKHYVQWYSGAGRVNELSEEIASSDMPMFLFDNKANLLLTYRSQSKGEKIYALAESSTSIYLGGSTTEKGYIGYENPYFICVSKDSLKETSNEYLEYKSAKCVDIEWVSNNKAGLLLKAEDVHYEYVKRRKTIAFNGSGNFSKSSLAPSHLKCEWAKWSEREIGGCGLINHDGTWVILPVTGFGRWIPNSNEEWAIYPFVEGLAMVAHKGLLGYVDKEANVVVPYQYEQGLHFSEGLAAVCRENKWGFIDKKGAVVVPLQYDDIKFFGDVRYPGFSEGLAPVCKGDKWGFIDKIGNTVIPFEYDGAAPFENGKGSVMINDTVFYIDKAGKVGDPVNP